MSFIYEALKRAEDEHAKGLPGPRVIRRPAFLGARPPWWMWALIGVLGANAAVLVTLVIARGSRPPAATPSAVTSSEPVSAPMVSRPPDAETAPAPPAARPLPPPPAVAKRPATVVTPPAARVDPRQRASTPSAVAHEAVAPRPSTPSSPVTPPSPAVAPAVSPPVPAVAPPASAPAPARATPPTVESPKLQVQVVVYSDVPAERLVFIDGRRYAEGDRVDAETVVERITADGAVVTRRGERITLTSGRP